MADWECWEASGNYYIPDTKHIYIKTELVLQGQTDHQFPHCIITHSTGQLDGLLEVVNEMGNWNI